MNSNKSETRVFYGLVYIFKFCETKFIKYLYYSYLWFYFSETVVSGLKRNLNLPQRINYQLNAKWFLYLQMCIKSVVVVCIVQYCIAGRIASTAKYTCWYRQTWTLRSIVRAVSAILVQLKIILLWLQMDN